MNSCKGWAFGAEEWAKLNKKERYIFRGCVDSQRGRERLNGWWLKRNFGDDRNVKWGSQPNLLCSVMLCGDYFGR